MMLYKNTKVKVRLLDEDTDCFDTVAGVLQRDTLAPYLFIICLDYLLKTSIDLMKEKASRWQRKEYEDTPHRLLQTLTTPMLYCF